MYELRVYVEGMPEVKELLFEHMPRQGETVKLPKWDFNQEYRVAKITHYARPNDNEAAWSHVTLHKI